MKSYPIKGKGLNPNLGWILAHMCISKKERASWISFSKSSFTPGVVKSITK